jgi:transcriptional regulator GlxA family with amidase domain
MTRTIGIFVFDGVEVLDFAGPYEVFTCASRVHGGEGGQPAPFRVVTIGRHADMLRARAGLTVLPEADFSTMPRLDVLLIPGGVIDAELARPEVIDWIAATDRHTEITASICNGAILLAATGLLDGLPATTHWADMDELRERFPAVQVQQDRRWVDNGRIVTSGGISAGIDMSLHLVGRLAGMELARRTALRMEYDWRDA